MIKNIFYSVFLHSLLILTFIISFKKQSIIESYNQQLSVGFSNSISASELSTLKLSQLAEKKIENPNPKIEPDKNNLSASLKNKQLIEKPPIKQIANKTNSSNAINNNLNNTLPSQNQQVLQNNSANTPDKPVTESTTNLIKTETKTKTKQVENLVKNYPANIKSLEESSLSFKEKTNILSQLKMCYKRAITETRQASKLSLEINVKISKEGYIESDLNQLIDKIRYNNPEHHEYKKLIDNLKKALDLCSPLRNLPSEKYDVWRELILRFDPE